MTLLHTGIRDTASYVTPHQTSPGNPGAGFYNTLFHNTGAGSALYTVLILKRIPDDVNILSIDLNRGNIRSLLSNFRT